MRPEQVSNIDDFLALARNARPTPIDELEMRRLARAALTVAERTQPVVSTRKVRVRSLLAATLPMLALALLLGWYVQDRRGQGTAVEVGRDDLALRLALRPGDVVIAAPGTRLQIVTQEVAARRLQVRRGAALFDVVPLAAGQMFEVETEHARMRVLGTVFSVEVTAARTIVRVYEGRVFIAGRSLGAGQSWVSAGDLPSASQWAPLAAEAAQHAALRDMGPTLPPAPLPALQAVATSLARPLPVRVVRDASSAARVYAEATRRLYNVGDAVGALGLLDAYDLDAENAVLRERASVLRVDALLKLGRVSQAAEVARRYVLREPETHTSVRMRTIAAGLTVPVTVAPRTDRE